MQKPFQTNPWELGHLLESIDKGQIVVPEFQRSFVWDPADTFDLIISISNSYPAGSLLFVRQKREHTLESRLIEGVETDPKRLLEPEQLVLDGQQRLTSLYQALYGKGRHRFMIDLEKLRNGGELEDALFPERADRARRFDGLENQFYYQYLPLTSVLGREPSLDKWMFDYIEYRVGRFDEDRKLLQGWMTSVKERFLMPIQRYEFPVIELSDSTSLEAICRIFETLNLKGVKLTVFEILTAKLFSKLKLRDMWRKARESNPVLSQFIAEEESTYVLKTVALLKYKDNPAQTLSCKRSALLDLDAEDLQNHWDEAVRSINNALIVLRNEHGVISKKWLPYVTILPPLAAVLSISESLSPGPMEGEARTKIFRWFWASVFGQRYESGTDTKSVTDLIELLSWIKGGEEPGAVRNFRLDTNELRTISDQRNAIYRGLISLVVRNGALDFHNKSRISTLDLQEEGIEDHHVFPYQYLVDNGVKGSVKDSILNKTLIDASTNSSIGKNPPSAYLQEIKEEERDSILKSHLLIRDANSPLLRDDFSGFLDERQDIFGELIAAQTGARFDKVSKVSSSLSYSPELEEAEEEEEVDQARAAPLDLSSVLTGTLGEQFQRVGNSSMYRSSARLIVARWSHRYERKVPYYWYRLTPEDLIAIKTHGVSDFAYVCDDSGTVVIPAAEMVTRVDEGRLGGTFKDGQVHHYHLTFRESSHGLEWYQKDGASENVQHLFRRGAGLNA